MIAILEIPTLRSGPGQKAQREAEHIMGIWKASGTLHMATLNGPFPTVNSRAEFHGVSS